MQAKSEPLAGQLAVADVILNRTESGRFPRSVCGVVTQRGQFSFVRGGKLPTPPANGQWKKALAVAQVAMKDQWDLAGARSAVFPCPLCEAQLEARACGLRGQPCLLSLIADWRHRPGSEIQNRRVAGFPVFA